MIIANEYNMMPELTVEKISKDTNFWMLRTKHGFFFDEFVEKEFAAIGWNCITDKKLTENSEESLKASIKEIYGESKPGTALNKCIRFCRELKPGDIAVIVDNGRIAFARIGEYYEESNFLCTAEREKEIHEKIDRKTYGQELLSCPYVKRRKISVIKVVGSDEHINPYLQGAIVKNWHSLSRLDEYAELILCACYDAFVLGGKLTVTFRIRRKEAINVVDLSNLALSAAGLLSDGKPETVQVKTTLHSPGEVILQILDFTQKNALPLLICYLIMFGGKAGNYEFNSLLKFIKDFVNRRYDKQRQELELRKIKAETELAEQEILNKKLENLEKMRSLQLSEVDSCAEQLASAAENLKIRPDSGTAKKLAEIMKEYGEK